MKKILVVSPFRIFPVNYGGRVDIFSRIKSLKSLGYLIDLVYIDYVECSMDEEIFKYVDKLIYVKREKNLKHFLLSKPYQVSSRNKLKKSLSLEDTYDYVLLESDSVGSIILNKSLKANHIILRVHNIESKYFFNLFKSSFPSFSSLYYISDSIKYFFYEKKLYSKIDNYLFISKDEMENMEKKFSNKNMTYLLPNIESDSLMKPSVRDKKNVLFIGSLFMTNNQEAILWYLKNIHSDLVNNFPDYQLYIVGSTNGKNISSFKRKLENFSNVKIILDVDVLDDYFSSASIFINPTIHGAGVKVKTLDSIKYGVPLVSTSVGVEGIGLEDNKHAFIKDTCDGFYSSIVQLFNNPYKGLELVLNSQELLRQHLSTPRLHDFLNKLN